MTARYLAVPPGVTARYHTRGDRGRGHGGDGGEGGDSGAGVRHRGLAEQRERGDRRSEAANEGPGFWADIGAEGTRRRICDMGNRVGQEIGC